MTSEPTIRMLMPQHRAILRFDNMAQIESDGSFAVCAADNTAARGGSSTSHQISNARIRPGTPER